MWKNENSQSKEKEKAREKSKTESIKCHQTRFILHISCLNAWCVSFFFPFHLLFHSFTRSLDACVPTHTHTHPCVCVLLAFSGLTAFGILCSQFPFYSINSCMLSARTNIHSVQQSNQFRLQAASVSGVNVCVLTDWMAHISRIEGEICFYENTIECDTYLYVHNVACIHIHIKAEKI